MIIQCPECASRYKTRVLPDGHSPVQVKCPKCSHRFLVSNQDAVGGTDQSPAPIILMVEDARFFRELMVDLLKERKEKLLTVDSAEDAWVMLHKQKIDLLIVDINLPDKNGLDLIREIRADGDFNKLPILCISGVYRKDDDAMKALRAGADDFLSKSFKPHELDERIDKLLKK
jgi:predicted Zn finger-like uncharacterized protein